MLKSLLKVTIPGIVMIFLVYITGCNYDYIEFEQPPLTDTVYFATQIEPIFNDGGNCTACHKPGGISPDLSTGNAYSSIQSLDLVSVSSPETSKIYTVPNPANSSEHAWKKYSPTEAALILNWITQGALDNK